MIHDGTPGPGDVFRGYRIESEIGRGGMGVVYLAEHLHLARKVALKLMPPQLAHDDTFRERFKRESQMAAALRHPNIVPIFDAGEDDGILYISMAYIAGSDLKGVIKGDGALPLDRAVSLLEQVADALDEAHDADLIHRDIKPQNILVEPRVGRRVGEHAYLGDFGLTKQRGSQGPTAVGMVVGTVDYMSPEQLRGEDLDRRADIYALGCVLFEALTGGVPFRRESDIGTITAHLQDPPPPVTAFRPELPEDIDAVVFKALAKTPQERFASCGDMVEAAAEVLRKMTQPIPQSGGTVIGPVHQGTLGSAGGIAGPVAPPVPSPPDDTVAVPTQHEPDIVSGPSPQWPPTPYPPPEPYPPPYLPPAKSPTVQAAVEAISGAVLVLGALIPWVTVAYTAACSPGCPASVDEFSNDARTGLEIVNRLGIYTLLAGLVLIALGLSRLAKGHLPAVTSLVPLVPGLLAGLLAFVKLLHTGERAVEKGQLELKPGIGLFVTLLAALAAIGMGLYAAATWRRT